MTNHPATFLRQLFNQAVIAADPMQMLAPHLPERTAGRVVVVGAGKASARMAEAVETTWGTCEGLVITRYGHSRPLKGIEVIEAAHPVPDAAGVAATRRMLDRISGLEEGDFVLVLISGGASALLCTPAGKVTLAEKQVVTAALLASGAPIDRINTLRKHLSLVKGGQLAAATRARMLALLISDVPGDDPGLIGSGPTVGDASTPEEAMSALKDWAIAAPQSVRALLSGPSRLVPPDDSRLDRVETRVIAAPAQSLEAAAELARGMGCEVHILGDSIEGEARAVAVEQARTALAIRAENPQAPVLLLSGGEVTVTRRGDGIGGPNAEFCLALALALGGAPGIHALACDTDGVDGAAEVAGAVIGPDTLTRARAIGLDPQAALDANDAHRFFAAAGGQVVTGPTLTNVNDFRAVLILPE